MKTNNYNTVSSTTTFTRVDDGTFLINTSKRLFGSDREFEPLYGVLYANIKPYFDFYIKNCKSLYNPYHNLNHTLSVMYGVYEGFKSNRNKRIKYDLRVLLLSALFHDANHSGGKESDENNVKCAISFLKEAHRFIMENDRTKAVKTSVLKQAINCIKATQYPYVIEDENLNNNQKLLRDCDILSYFGDTWISHTLFGLSKESNTDDYGDVLDRMEDFLSHANATIRTHYGKQMMSLRLEKWKKNKEYLVKNLFI